MDKKLKAKGFTLIEILVVIGLIAILAAIVLIAINPGRQFAQARNSQRTSNVEAILNAIGQYTADNKGDLPSIPSGEIDEDLCDDLVPTYLPALPTDPASDSDGASITTCSTIGVGDVGYTVTQSGGRITVTAPDTESPLTTDISVTR
jgi:prepilin-type N-terminal cleavage/methylation domain-containing protein